MADRPAKDSHTEITLGLLGAVEENSALTQRHLARRLGVALGLVNVYLKRCIHKGLIKVKQVPPNRYAYYLTPKGFAEKSRLTVQYLSISLSFFRIARNECGELLAECAGQGRRRIALAGAGELAEIMTLCARDHAVELVGIVDLTAAAKQFAGLTVLENLDGIAPIDAVIVTDVTAPQATFDDLVKSLGPERVLAPKLLNVSRPAVVRGRG